MVLFSSDVPFEIRESSRKVRLYKRSIDIVVNVVDVFVSAVAWILDKLIQRMVCPILKAWALILSEFRVNQSKVIYFQKSIFMSLNKHRTITTMEHLSWPCQLQRYRIRNFLLNLLIRYISSLLIMLLPSHRQTRKHTRRLRRLIPECSIVARLVVFTIRAHVTGIHAVGILRKVISLLGRSVCMPQRFMILQRLHFLLHRCCH